jgi:predicted ATP-dependent endonuclease of OLD family
MKIKTVSIRNFRGIGDKGIFFDCENFNLFIGNNGTCKTAVLEAMNLGLSPSYAASRISIKDFHKGSDHPIEVSIAFEKSFDVAIPDVYGNDQNIKCGGISLVAKKRDRSAPGRAFNDLVVFEHYFVPIEERGQDGWVITRKNSSKLKIAERHLSMSNASADTPRAFYFDKERDRQLQRGYNSSISNIIDDLNWRFEKGQRTEPDPEKFKHKREELENHVFHHTEGETLKRTLHETNKTLRELDIPEIELSLIKTLTPYDSADIVRRFDGFELPIKQAGSGIEMVSSLIFLDTLAKISKSEIVLLIDEPELHLHPKLQDKVASFLLGASRRTQIFVSTHSPLFFRDCYSQAGVSALVFDASHNRVDVTNAKARGLGVLRWGPSWGEICYFAYELATSEFHDDLYAALQDKHGIETISQTEAWLTTHGEKKEIRWTSGGSLKEETLMTAIRNKMHHGDNQDRPAYSPQQLRDSIERLIGHLK